MEKVVQGAEGMWAFASEFVEFLKKSHGVDRTAATVIGLSGELGAGKTTFVQGVARALSIVVPVASPTFVIEKIYALENEPWQRLAHIDAYRLENGEELAHLGFRELAADPGNLIFIEWPERVAEVLPRGTIRGYFDVVADGKERSVRFMMSD